MAKSAKKITPLGLYEDISPAGNEWLNHCKLEGIYPTQQTMDELSLLTSGKMSPDEFTAYVVNKYSISK